MSTADRDWFEDFFDEDYLRFAADRYPPEATAAEAGLMIEALALEPGTRVLDLACGHGRHSVELARHGCAVTGVDLSEPSLALAAARAAEAGVALRLEHADMRRIGFDAEFDAVINMFTAFGYFADEADNGHVMRRIAAALAPGGALLLETINPVAVFSRFEARGWHELSDGTVMLEERAYDAAGGRFETTWTFTNGSERRIRRFSHRAYTAPELAAMAAGAGLEVERLWGGLDGSDLEMGSRRIVMLARRPG
jgi:cyclopropane fatty-acyl-phospholipid synthase-like methyltransferase